MTPIVIPIFQVRKLIGREIIYVDYMHMAINSQSSIRKEFIHDKSQMLSANPEIFFKLLEAYLYFTLLSFSDLASSFIS